MTTLLSVLERLAVARPIASSTYANYRRAVRYFSDHIGREASVDDLDEHAVSAWLKLLEERYPPGYVRNLRRDLLVSWRFAADLELKAYPRTRLIRLAKREIKTVHAWPIDWIGRLIGGTKKLDGCYRSIGARKREYAEAYFRTQIELLCRPSDMRRLTWPSVSIDGKVIWKQSKTGVPHRAKLSSDTLEALDRIKGLDRFLIFPLSKSSTERMIQDVFSAAGIDKPPRQSLGHVRHTGGTAIAKTRGNDAARTALGHLPQSRVFEGHYLDSAAIAVDYCGWWQ